MSIRTSFSPLGKGAAVSSEDSTIAGIIKNHPFIVEGFPDIHNEELGWHVYKFNTGLGDTYCFRGNGNNYFKMGTYTVSGYTDGEITGIGANIIWRIIRVNEDGSVRMIAHDYDTNGRPAIPNGIPDYDVMRGGNASGFYNDWFTNRTDLTSYFQAGIIRDGPFYWDMTYSGSPIFNYIAAIRITANNSTLQPTLYDSTWLPRGEFKGYIWSVNNSVTERQISTPCGLITGDELIISGVVPGITTSNFAIQNGKGYEAVCAPNQWLGNFGVSRTSTYGVSYGNLGTYLANGNRAVIRPVINIKGDIEVVGSGTLSDPWTLKEAI